MAGANQECTFAFWQLPALKEFTDDRRRHVPQQHGTNETRNTLNNNLNTNLMQGHRDSSVSPCSLPEITEHRIFYILFYCEQISLKGIIFCT